MPFTQMNQIILLIFDTISIIIYILFLFTIIVNRKQQPFQSEFFRLSISLGVADIATVIHSYIFVRFPSWGWDKDWFLRNGSNGSFLPFYAISVQFALSFSQHLGVLLIGINRYSRIVLKQSSYDKMWSGRKLYIAVALQWFLATVWWATMIPQDFNYWNCYNNATSLSAGHFVATVDFTEESVQAIYYALAFALNVPINLISFAIYAVVFILSIKYTLKRRHCQVGVAESTPSTLVNAGHSRRIAISSRAQKRLASVGTMNVEKQMMLTLLCTNGY
uniref:Vomeronasal type-1 receptor n=1 Tax=Plectus sambesii TaxID=2011161 RepID=A0A914VHR6_9BILA